MKEKLNRISFIASEYQQGKLIYLTRCQGDHHQL